MSKINRKLVLLRYYSIFSPEYGIITSFRSFNMFVIAKKSVNKNRVHIEWNISKILSKVEDD